MATTTTKPSNSNSMATANKNNNNNNNKAMKKSTDNTVFIRFTPASSEVNRWHLEEFFSAIGPIKKCSVISSSNNKKSVTKNSLGYGFVKFVSLQDAQQAARDCNHKSLTVNGKQFQLTVELASKSHAVGGGRGAATVTESVKKERQPTKEQPKELSKELPQEPEREEPVATATNTDSAAEAELLAANKRKRTCRVIVRNLSFYANETIVKAALEQEFGAVTEVTLPRVNPKLHRGFCFATFQNLTDAQQATAKRAKPFEIQKRPVAIDFCMAKAHHQQQKQQALKEKQEERQRVNAKKEEEGDEEEEGEEEMNDASGDDASDDDASDDDEVSDDSDDDSNSPSSKTKVVKKEAPLVDEGVTTQRTLFIRNLPFDATRNDIFQLLKQFGHIDSIHPVMDRSTGVFKGTAFLAYAKPDAAAKALAAAKHQDYGDAKFLSQRRQQGESGEGGLAMRGRRLMLDLAVDKGTASTLTMEKSQDGNNNKMNGRDRRNLYLKNEGYINTVAHATDTPTDNVKRDPSAWENLPESDQLKRQRALSDKTTKLRSPLFFINAKRLSIRNLSKHLDEADLKRLLVLATQRGMERLVKADDQVAHWRSGGEMTARDIMTKLSEAKTNGKSDTDASSVLPAFDDMNIKKYMPSVFIDRDFTVGTATTTPDAATTNPSKPIKKEKAPSRGFGFVDFTHHVHALACLRELNNNPTYSAEFVTGGKRAVELKKSKLARSAKANAKKAARKGGEESAGEFTSPDGRQLVPRLIVEFTVENKAKAQQQASNRTKQAANVEKQRLDKLEKREKKKKEKVEKKQSRGALQREKKRKRLEAGVDPKKKEEVESEASDMEEEPQEEQQKKLKKVKPPKKQKVDKEEQSFEKLVRSYTDTFQTAADAEEKAEGVKDKRAKVAEKRWFE